MWRDEFLQALISSDLREVQIERARILKQTHLPPSVFKLRIVSEFSLANLHDDTIWVSGADEFNDPFDSAHSIDASTVLSSQPIARVIDAFRDSGAFSGLSDSDVQAIRESNDPFLTLFKRVTGLQGISSEESALREVLEHRASELLDDYYQKTVRKLQRGIKASCFTTKNQSVVMWSHYANYHKGFSVEYDLHGNRDSPLALQLWPVIYRSQIFDATPYLVRAAKGETFNNLFGFIAALHKSPDWEYEDEWRVIAPLGLSQPSFNMEMPKPIAIYLGARISAAHRDLLLNIARRRSIPVFEMLMSRTEFAVVPHKVAV